MITMQRPKRLYDSLYPSVLQKNLPKSILECLASSLNEDPMQRTSFQEMFEALASDTSNFESNDCLNEAQTWLDDEGDS
jgi:hypothetical protein